MEAAERNPGEENEAPEHGTATSGHTGKQSIAPHGETSYQVRAMLLKNAAVKIGEDAEPDSPTGHHRIL
jgi:hypothetical protein